MDNYNGFVVSTRVRLARNIVGLPFPSKLSGSEEGIFAKLMKGVQSATSELGEFDFYKLDGMNEVERMALFERHLISLEMLSNVSNGAVVLDKERQISIMINEEDHIRAQCVLDGFDLVGAYKKINQFDNCLSKNLEIAYKEGLGYLTSCPTNLGTGMRASVMLFLPALSMSGRLGNILASAQSIGLTTRGVYGEGSEVEGFMYQVSNQNSLGKSEEEILRLVSGAVEKLCDAEKKARDRLMSESKIEIKDSLMRSFGVLKTACIISQKEFSELLAKVKLGVYFGLLKVPYKTLNDLSFQTKSANLCKLTNKQLDARACDIARATLTREKLKNYLIEN